MIMMSQTPERFKNVEKPLIHFVLYLLRSRKYLLTLSALCFPAKTLNALDPGFEEYRGPSTTWAEVRTTSGPTMHPVPTCSQSSNLRSKNSIAATKGWQQRRLSVRSLVLAANVL